MDSIEHYDEERNLARVRAGYRGGPFMDKLVTAPERNFVDGYPAEVAAKLRSGKLETPKPIDPWGMRHGNY